MERCGAIQGAWNVAGRCNASQDAQDAWDAENTSLASGRNADGSDAGSVFADVLAVGSTDRGSATVCTRDMIALLAA